MKNLTDDTNRQYLYYDVLAILIVVLTVLANIVSFKHIQVGPFSVRMGVFVSAASYIIAHIVVEVYGFAYMRRIVWMLTASILLSALVFQCAIMLPAAHQWQDNEMFNAIFDRNARTVASTMIALFMGHMTNAIIMAKLKVLTKGDQLWMRMICAGFISHGLNAVLFYSLAMTGVMQPQEILPAIVSSWFLRIAYEALMMPITISIIKVLKRIEGVDIFDEDTSFNPFRFALVRK